MFLFFSRRFVLYTSLSPEAAAERMEQWIAYRRSISRVEGEPSVFTGRASRMKFSFQEHQVMGNRGGIWWATSGHFVAIPSGTQIVMRFGIAAESAIMYFFILIPVMALLGIGLYHNADRMLGIMIFVFVYAIGLLLFLTNASEAKENMKNLLHAEDTPPEQDSRR